MYSENNNISIEQYAAFLDGNLSEEDMQAVAMAIDSDKEYSDILGEAMHVDESVEVYMNRPEDWQDEILDTDFDLPVVPLPVDAADVVELSVANPAEPDVVEVGKSDIRLAALSDPIEGVDGIAAPQQAESQLTPSSDVCDMDSPSDEAMDMVDFT